MILLADAIDPGAEAVGGILMIGLYVVGFVVAVAWLILPFVIVSKANRVISLLQSQYELQFRDATQQAVIAAKLTTAVEQLQRITGEPPPPGQSGQ